MGDQGENHFQISSKHISQRFKTRDEIWDGQNEFHLPHLLASCCLRDTRWWSVSVAAQELNNLSVK